MYSTCLLLSAVIFLTPYSSASLTSSSDLFTPEKIIISGDTPRLLQTSSSPGLQTSTLENDFGMTLRRNGFALMEKQRSTFSPKVFLTKVALASKSSSEKRYAGEQISVHNLFISTAINPP